MIQESNKLDTNNNNNETVTAPEIPNNNESNLKRKIVELSLDEYNQFKRIKEQAVSTLDKYYCLTCMEIAEFPVFYQCKNHMACYKCIFQWFNIHKKYIDNKYVCSINCTSCASEQVKNDPESNMDINFIRILDCLSSFELKIRNDLIKSLNIETNDTFESNCPYCNIQITPLLKNHVYLCTKKKLKCHKCGLDVIANELPQHWNEHCFQFKCNTCKNNKLNRLQYRMHELNKLVTSDFYKDSVMVNCKNLKLPNDAYSLKKLINQYKYIYNVFNSLKKYCLNPSLQTMNQCNIDIIYKLSSNLINIDHSIFIKQILDNKFDPDNSSLNVNNNNNNNMIRDSNLNLNNSDGD